MLVEGDRRDGLAGGSAFARRSSRISTLWSWPSLATSACFVEGQLLAHERVVGLTDSAMRASMAIRSSGVRGRGTSKS